MKSNIIYRLIIICLLLTINACSKGSQEIDAPITTPDKNDTIAHNCIRINTASPLTRVAYTQEGIKVAWSITDRISIIDKTENNATYIIKDKENNLFEIEESQKVPQQAPFKIFFPANNFEEELVLTNQKQKGNNNTDHLSFYTYMMGESSDLSKEINLKHLTAQIKFYLTVPSEIQASNLEKIVFSANKNIFINKTNTNGEILESSSSVELLLEVDDISLNDKNNYLLTAYMMVFPIDFKNANLKVELIDKSNKVVAQRMLENVSQTYYAGFQYYAMKVDNPDLTKETIISESDIEWKQFGPGMSGNNKSARWHPTDPNYLYISPNMGNCYISTDKGKTYKTVLQYDEASYKIPNRGPREFTSLDFSRKDDKYGFATDERNFGLYLTKDKGHSWIINKTFNKSYLSCVTVDPSDDNIWYLGAGRLRNLANILFPQNKPRGEFGKQFQPQTGMIWKSKDKGKTWQVKNNGIDPKADIESIYVDPSNTNILYVSTNYGFYKSTDNGDSWVKRIIESEESDVVRSLAMHHKNGVTTLYAICNITWKTVGSTLTDDKGGIYKSTDRGESWTKITNNLPLNLQSVKSSIVEGSYANVAAYYLGLSKNNFLSTYPTLPTSLTQRLQTIVIDPKDANNVFLTNEYSNASRTNHLPGQLWRSTNGGASWFVAFRNGSNWSTPSTKDYAYWSGRGNPMGNNATFKYLKHWEHRDPYERKSCNFVAFNADGTVVHTQMAKISMMSYNNGDTWEDIDDVETGSDNSFIGAGNSNLPGHGFYQHTLLPGKVFCCSGENSLWITNSETNASRDGELAATNVTFTGEEMSLSSYAVHPTDITKHYALFFRQHNKGKLMRSTDSGKTWAIYGTAIPSWETNAYSGDQSVHQNCLIIDPQNPNNIYFCVPWKSSSLEFVGDSKTGFGVHKSSDGGRTWKEINNGLPYSDDGKGSTTQSEDGLSPKPSVPRIAFDPNNSNILYAAVERKNGGLFKSTDKGESWHEVESTKFMTQHNGVNSNAGINDIHFDINGYAYVTVGSINADKNDPSCGLWVSYNNMKSWLKLFNFPFVSRIETARYDSKIVLITTLSNFGVGYINAGVYLSRDGGITWCKINKGNGQSDRINDIAIDYSRKGRYYASSYGSSWYFTDDK